MTSKNRSGSIREEKGLSEELPEWSLLDFEKDIELGDIIGGGGVGVIYRGWFRGEEVALKALFDPRVDEKLKQEYLDELLVMSKLKHSNIVEFLGACMTPPNLCFVMEVCEDSLYQLLHVKRVEFTEKETLQMALDIASAMEYLHAQRPCIIHRDLKTHNVLKAFNGAMKLCDFGLVRIRNTRAGTPAYMAPELIEGRSFNRSVDVFAFGVFLNELFTQRIPFYGVPIDELRERVVEGDRPPLATWGNPRIVQMITKCWHVDPDERMEFTEIVDELIDVLDNTKEHSCTEEVKLSDGQYEGDALDILMTPRTGK
eukprot:CAMPEP_0182421992 /NCGR_PEP_ID=MMETSP1167-20130531/7586_1 /TAXON_ID=2988 /ORGANISM="Mallomonas Sp, Strain CCMP3275" /LENGTH=313 /DNA_ID=CAMNT_0024599681 /DNA_START=112 /DNA_END=1053 /DNA_ORIENTATION=-